MKYFLIAGEASGDLHASHLITALRARDAKAEFRFFGGDLMAEAAGSEPIRHYKSLAYMGIVQVALHLRTILRGMRTCKEAIREWQPDCVILIDYPGFNLSIAEFVHKAGICPVYYYISPKIWAWKEGRIKRIRRDVDRLFSILPFEVDFYEGKHHYPITYVGNPTLDEVAEWRTAVGSKGSESSESSGGLEFLESSEGPSGDIIALLPGSRTAEITSNLPRMLKAALPYAAQGYRLVVAGAPSQQAAFYEQIFTKVGAEQVELVFGQTFTLLNRATAALVTSGTATLETALFRVPQVVCFHIRGGRIINWGRPYVLKVPYISLPNLICRREIIPELIAADTHPSIISHHLQSILPGGSARESQLSDYDDLYSRLGQPGAPAKCADEIYKLLTTP